MNNNEECRRIEIRIDRASASRALLVGGVLVLLGTATGISFAVPITYTAGDVLTAGQLNDNFANVEQRLAALEGSADVGRRYTVRTSLTIPGVGKPILAACDPGDRVLMGSCYVDEDAGQLVFWRDEPQLTGTNGWMCAGTMRNFSATYVALAVCAGNGVDRTIDLGIYPGFEPGPCPGSAVLTGASQSCQDCAAQNCCDQLNDCLLDTSCVAGGSNNSNSIALGNCLVANSCGC